MLKVTVFLLLGAIVNVAVAWGLNLLPYSYSGHTFTYLPDEDGLEWWRAHAPMGFPARPAGINEQRLVGRQSDLLYEHPYGEPSYTFGDNVDRFRVGLPCLSMESASWVNRKARSGIDQNRLDIPPGWPGTGRWLSLKPLLPGFAINTIFYATIFWLMFVRASVLYRKRRIKRGLCPACAYPIGTSDICTECGQPVKPKYVEVAT